MMSRQGSGALRTVAVLVFSALFAAAVENAPGTTGVLQASVGGKRTLVLADGPQIQDSHSMFFSALKVRVVALCGRGEHMRSSRSLIRVVEVYASGHPLQVDQRISPTGVCGVSRVKNEGIPTAFSKSDSIAAPLRIAGCVGGITKQLNSKPVHHSSSKSLTCSG